MKVKLLNPKALVQPLISRMQEGYQSPAVSFGKSLGNIGVPGHQIGKTHGHIRLEVNIVHEILILIFQAFCFVDMNQASLETIGNREESGGSYRGEEKEGNEKLPLKTNIVQPR